MYELSLFTGAGGGLLGTHLLGWTPIGYVEFNDYCQRVIRQRIVDGILPNAPIYGDIRTFVSSGCAKLYRGVTDVITAGFPCQPFSTAGQQLGANDPRNMWPATFDTIRIVRPRYAFLENVPALINSGYFQRILGDLASVGMDARWGVFSACAVGAPHTRERLFVLAYANSDGVSRGKLSKHGTASVGRHPPSKRSYNHAQSRRPAKTQIWDTQESDILRVADGVGSKLERIRSVANGQVPLVAATAWRLLIGDK